MAEILAEIRKLFEPESANTDVGSRISIQGSNRFQKKIHACHFKRQAFFMDKSTDDPSTAQTFLVVVMLALIVAGIAFGIFSFNEENGLFAIASAISLSSLMFGCIRILN